MSPHIPYENSGAPPTGVTYGDECYAIQRLASVDAVFVERVTPPGPKFSIPMKMLAEGTDLPTVYRTLLKQDKNAE